MNVVKFLLLSLISVQVSWSCIAVKPKEFDDVMPLTRIPPTNPLWTTEAMIVETTEGNMVTTSQTLGTTMQTTSTSTMPSSTTTRDPCDDCPLPMIFPVTDNVAPCFGGDPTLPQIMISALPNGMNCELVASGCNTYETVLVDGGCNVEFFMPNPICQNGFFIGDLGIGITKVRCST